MSVLGRILDKLGLRKRQPPAQSGSATTTGTPRGPAPTGGSQGNAPGQRPGTATTGAAASTPAAQASRPEAMSDVDVTAMLERLAADNPQKLNWRTSIVDLMKLLGMESSLAERKELAAELGYPREQMDDTAKMNVWLHKQVLRKVAENGGKVPPELLD
jgi:hypothetical protein